ncbi:hypothetical protein KDH_68580 [Dictyobacter sp. S3.2.2.5]|uniref:Uncharacterized protein n=1 Tax=Dictyobacter halimunensis TaxID=3026934 RepID=A0ABQ6G0J8_9CHLR|nr:hypothetical protein KDH_68580 [Dictyobacter sp. S3.2.2.5]
MIDIKVYMLRAAKADTIGATQMPDKGQRSLLTVIKQSALAHYLINNNRDTPPGE